MLQLPVARKEKRKDYAFRRQFNEKPSIIPGCPEYLQQLVAALAAANHEPGQA